MDATIANFLEGVVTYDPIPSPPAKPAPKPLPPPSYITSTPPTFKSSSLRPRKYYSPAMEAMHRQLSLEERKRELVQKARQWVFNYTHTLCIINCYSVAGATLRNTD